MPVENIVHRLEATGVNIGIVSPKTPDGERYISARVHRLLTPGVPITNGTNLPEKVGHIGPWLLPADKTETGRTEIGEGYMGPESAVNDYIHTHYAIRPGTITYTEVLPGK